MTIKIRNITMVRGDSESITVKCFTESGGTKTASPFTTGDTVTFTVRKDPKSTILLQKAITEFDENGYAVILLYPEDTSGMDFGKYVYDIQLTRSDDSVTTIVPISSFILAEEVTY